MISNGTLARAKDAWRFAKGHAGNLGYVSLIRITSARGNLIAKICRLIHTECSWFRECESTPEKKISHTQGFKKYSNPAARVATEATPPPPSRPEVPENRGSLETEESTSPRAPPCPDASQQNVESGCRQRQIYGDNGTFFRKLSAAPIPPTGTLFAYAPLYSEETPPSSWSPATINRKKLISADLSNYNYLHSRISRREPGRRTLLEIREWMRSFIVNCKETDKVIIAVTSTFLFIDDSLRRMFILSLMFHE